MFLFIVEVVVVRIELCVDVIRYVCDGGLEKCYVVGMLDCFRGDFVWFGGIKCNVFGEGIVE